MNGYVMVFSATGQKCKEADRYILYTWQFTYTQKDIASLLLKSLNVCEIAEMEYVQEKTIRNHLSAIYSKSNLLGSVWCNR